MLSLQISKTKQKTTSPPVSYYTFYDISPNSYSIEHIWTAVSVSFIFRWFLLQSYFKKRKYWKNYYSKLKALQLIYLYVIYLLGSARRCAASCCIYDHAYLVIRKKRNMGATMDMDFSMKMIQLWKWYNFGLVLSC